MTLPFCVRIDADDTRSAEQLKLDGWREGDDTLETYMRPHDLNGHLTRDPPPGACAKPEEVDVCIAIANDAFSPKDKTAWVREAFERNDRHVFVKREGGEVVGFIITRVDPGIMVVDLIASKYPRRGIGGYLIDAALWQTPYWRTKSGTTMPHTQVRAGTSSANSVARQFYTGLGFAPLHTRRTFFKEQNCSA